VAKELEDFPGPDRVSLFEVEAEVENVLKGTFLGSALTYYFYGQPLNMPLIADRPHQPDPGERYVLALTYDHETIRTVVDYESWPHELVYSGYHPIGFSQPQWTVGERIARILLTPGSGMVDHEFAVHLGRAADRAASEAGPLLTVELLRSALAYSGCETRTAACLYLAQRYPGEEACLTRVVADNCLGNLQDIFLVDVQHWLAAADQRAEAVARQIRDGGIPGVHSDWPWRQQSLELLVAHPDRRVSSAARAALAKLSHRSPPK
jgi:hypothetical protein